MNLNLKRDDQTTVINFSNQFINFYYTCLNNKEYNKLYPHLKDHTIFSSEKTRHNGQNIINYFKHLNGINAKFTNIDFDTLHAGARRINVLVTGTLTYNENNVVQIKNFAEYIHFGNDSKKGMWIQNSIMKLIK